MQKPQKLRKLGRLAPSAFVCVLLLGISTPALADIESGSAKLDVPAEDDEDEAKGGGCSVQDPKLELAGLAGLVLLISGVRLRRRQA